MFDGTTTWQCWWVQLLICSEFKFCKTANELIFVGGIDSNIWLDNGKQLSRNFKQGYRVYSSEGIACSITSNGGGLGACTGLYLV